MQYPAPPRELIERAFAQARKSGKADWSTMAIPVLKNRLLQLTGQRFKESDFGASSFREFVHAQSALLQIDTSFLPGAVSLKTADDSAPLSLPTSDQRERIRPDLWKAILDYSSGDRYVWDSHTGLATTSTGDATEFLLPTLSADGMKAWKAEYIATLASAVSGLERVQAWRVENLPTSVLPSEARSGWNRFLKEKVLATLAHWFEEKNLPLPALLSSPAPVVERTDETERLRAFVIECVRKMSKAELEQISIPSSVAFRAGSNR